MVKVVRAKREDARRRLHFDINSKVNDNLAECEELRRKFEDDEAETKRLYSEHENKPDRSLSVAANHSVAAGKARRKIRELLVELQGLGKRHPGALSGKTLRGMPTSIILIEDVL